MYKATSNPTCITRTRIEPATGLEHTIFVPTHDPLNVDFQEYQSWIAAGGILEAADSEPAEVPDRFDTLAQQIVDLSQSIQKVATDVATNSAAIATISAAPASTTLVPATAVTTASS